MRKNDANKQILKNALGGNLDGNPSVIVPMPFFIAARDCENRIIAKGNGYTVGRDKVIARNYSNISNNVFRLFPKLSSAAHCIIGYISNRIDFNSNCIIIKPDLYNAWASIPTEISDATFYAAIDSLIENFIIAKTELKSTYVVNPLAIFKGDIYKFYDTYNEYITGDFEYAVGNKVIIDKFLIIYNNGKEQRKVFYKNNDTALRKIKISKDKLITGGEINIDNKTIPIVSPKPKVDNEIYAVINGKKVKFNFRNKKK